MRRVRRLALALSVALQAAAFPASATEYRLQVVNLYESSFTSFLKPGELNDGASGAGLAALEASLDRGDVPKGTLLYDRHLQIPPEGISRAYGGVPVQAALQHEGFRQQLWDEARWEGKPGELSVWVIAPTSERPQELRRLALKGFGPLRQFQPYTLGRNAARLPAVSFPLNFLWAQEERATAGPTYVAPVLDLSDGIGAVVGVNHNSSFPDHVYLIVSQGEQPTTYKAVLAWRQRPEDIEAPRFRRLHR